MPVHITVRLLRRAMQSSPKRRFLIDGFPRNGNNLAGWHQVVGDAVHVGGYASSGGRGEKRGGSGLGWSQGLRRAAMTGHGRALLAPLPGAACSCSTARRTSCCVACWSAGRKATTAIPDPRALVRWRATHPWARPSRSKSSGRADDNEASIKKRFQTYRAQTMPVVEYYDQLGLVKRVDAAEPVEKVYGAIQDALRPVHDDHARRGGEVRCVLQLFCQDKSAADDYLARTGGIANALPSDGAVRATVASRVLFADESIKPYGLGSVRAFD